MERESMIQDEHIQTLIGFGLTLLQAKTYLTLAKLVNADVKTIAKFSNVARQDIYRIMPTLQKMGLVEKIIAKPTMYKATPITEGISLLLRNREKEDNKLKKKTASLIKNFQTQTDKETLTEEDTQFIITSEITRFLKIHRKQSQKAQESVDIMIPLIRVPLKFNDEWRNLKRPLKRGVKIRVITQKPEDEKTPAPWHILAENSFFEVKYLAAPIHFGMHIFDRKEVTLQVSAKSVLPSLWTNNPTVVELASSYFNEMWNKKQQQAKDNQK
jgi:sugar-specific transcriptional regulator TrmB